MQRTQQVFLPDRLCFLLKRYAGSPSALHGLSLKMGCLDFVLICNNIVHAYVRQHNLDDACKLFDEIPQRNVFSWTIMISGCSHAGDLKSSVLLFKQLMLFESEDKGEERESFGRSNFAFGSILKCCTESKDLDTGVQFHCSLVKLGLVSDTFMVNTLINMYARCGMIDMCWCLFAETTKKDVVTWTSMITGLVNSGVNQLKTLSFEFFKEMIRQGIRPLNVTFMSLTKLFDEQKMINQAKQLHGCIVKFGVEVDSPMGSALVFMYGKCQVMEDAIKVASRLEQKDTVSYTSFIAAYIRNGLYTEAIDVFRNMVKNNVSIDSFVLASVLGACSALSKVENGKEVHGYAIRSSLISDVAVGNAVITFYGRHGKVRYAQMVFTEIKENDAISLSALLTCYVQNGFNEEALWLFQEIRRSGINIGVLSITSSIRACSEVASLSTGEQIQSMAAKMGFENYLSVGNSLTTMYAKCGNIDFALKVFHSINEKDKISWNAIITGLAQHGFGEEALELYNQMEKEGVRPDEVTFLGVLTSCSHGGLVAKGCEYYNMMTIIHKMAPKREHYACMVDLYTRSGRFDDAMAFIDSMPCQPDVMVWETLLASCRVYQNLELGKFASEKILELGVNEPSAFILLSNMYAMLGLWEGKANMLRMMRNRGVKKESSKSWVECSGKLHIFSTNDKDHPQIYLIYVKLEELKFKMQGLGYVLDTKSTLQKLEHFEDKEYSILHHSEKLAVSFALITSVKGSPIRIIQNLRMCKDCHAFLKFASKIENRRIVVRDMKRFHHFIDGSCSCHDFW